MTLPKCGLHLTSSDNRRAFLHTLEFVACADVQLAQIRQTVIGQRVLLEPCPQIFAHQFAAVRSQSIQNNQHGLFEMRFECLRKVNQG